MPIASFHCLKPLLPVASKDPVSFRNLLVQLILDMDSVVVVAVVAGKLQVPVFFNLYVLYFETCRPCKLLAFNLKDFVLPLGSPVVRVLLSSQLARVRGMIMRMIRLNHSKTMSSCQLWVNEISKGLSYSYPVEPLGVWIVSD